MFKHFSAWLAENIFWPFLKAHFHMSDTSKRRKELTFYRKSDFQSVIDREFRKFAVDGRLKTLTPEQVERIVAGSDKAPALARCRLLPKKNLTSTRLLARKETTSDKVEIERDQRLLLRFIAKKLYSNMIDVKGKLLYLLSNRVCKMFLVELLEIEKESRSNLLLFALFLGLLGSAGIGADTAKHSGSNALLSASPWTEKSAKRAANAESRTEFTLEKTFRLDHVSC